MPWSVTLISTRSPPNRAATRDAGTRRAVLHARCRPGCASAVHQLVAVAVDEDARLARRDQRDVGRGGGRRGAVGGVAQQVLDADGLGVGEGVVALHPREVDQLDDQGGQTLGRLGCIRPAKRATASGSSAQASTDSARSDSAATGVFSSWLTFATKSRRTSSTRRASVESSTSTRTWSSAERRDPRGQDARWSPGVRGTRRRCLGADGSRRDQAYGSGEPGIGQPPVADHPERGGRRARPDHAVVTVQDHRGGPQRR